MTVETIASAILRSLDFRFRSAAMLSLYQRSMANHLDRHYGQIVSDSGSG